MNYIKDYKNQIIAAAFMTLAGVATGISSGSYIPMAVAVAQTAPILETQPETSLAAETAAMIAAETEAATEESTEAPFVFVPHIEQLNLAYFYPEGVDQNDVLNSYAGTTYKELTIKDSNWLSDIYDMADVTPEAMAKKLGRSVDTIRGYYNAKDEKQSPNDPDSWKIHSWKRVNISFYDGNGNRISAYSNVKDILSMASVYTYYTNLEDGAAFKEYAAKLWKASHSYSVSMSDVYFCDGSCRTKDSDDQSTLTAEELETSAAETAAAPADINTAATTDTTAAVPAATEISGPGKAIMESELAALYETATPSDAALPAEAAITEATSETAESTTAAETKNIICPGHVDLNITGVIAELSGEKGLFSRDAIGNNKKNYTETGWKGWTETTKAYATHLSEQDWYKQYQLSVSALCISNPLSAVDVDSYLSQLPAGISQTRRDIIQCALFSVGKIPYYWGGKPSTPNYEGNVFGSLLPPDEKGRNMRGLDCSGWINWVYWTSTGKALPYEGTDGLSSYGTAIKRSELQPGDIMIRLGINAHVVMFLNWEADGSMKVIHETSGAVNNVTVGIMNSNWPYYRRLVE